jgi:DNA-binding transcriptional MocR family regulator
MLTVPMNNDGPDMDVVEKLTEDESVKGMWCVPKYSNPTGIVYSDEVVKRLAKMETARDFRIFYDNAYAVHFLTEDIPLLNILDECKKAGNPDRVFLFTSTSKITLCGAGVAAMAASEANVREAKAKINIATIGPDKMNHLRHHYYFKDSAAVLGHMEKHAEILVPKFEAVEKALGDNLKDSGIAEWTNPKGGYFVSLEVYPGTAKRAVGLAKDAGVIFTPAGATYPYGKDPLDSNIRIAPTLPPVGELVEAMGVLICCVRIAAIEKLLERD